MRFYQILLPFLLLTVASLSAQTRAVTEHGDTIYISDDGRWAFTQEALYTGEEPSMMDFLNREIDIVKSGATYTHPTSANTKLSSRLGFYDVHYNNELWNRVPPGQLNADAEFALKSKSGEIFCVVIGEEVEMTSEAIFKIALNTMEERIGSAPELLKSEYRTVNGTELINARQAIALNGINFTFDAYYYSAEEGTVQFLVWTSNKLSAQYSDDIYDLLNGLVLKVD